jgi:hypothetical protein
MKKFRVHMTRHIDYVYEVMAEDEETASDIALTKGVCIATDDAGMDDPWLVVDTENDTLAEELKEAFTDIFEQVNKLRREESL